MGERVVGSRVEGFRIVVWDGQRRRVLIEFNGDLDDLPHIDVATALWKQYADRPESIEAAAAFRRAGLTFVRALSDMTPDEWRAQLPADVQQPLTSEPAKGAEREAADAGARIAERVAAERGLNGFVEGALGLVASKLLDAGVSDDVTFRALLTTVRAVQEHS